MGILEGKVAVVTGAGRGIGRAHAHALAEAGAAVAVNDLDEDQAAAVVEEIVGRGGRAAARGGDVTSFEGAEDLVSSCEADLGPVDILVNNAGIIRDAMSFSMTEDEWDDVIRVHLKGHFAPSRAVGRRWRERAKQGERAGGRIINTVSESGLYGLVGQVNYASAKAGIAAMTVVLARELEKYGVTVNAIAPRARTRMTESLLAGTEPTTGFDEWDPANISPTVVWLASDLAAGVTGQVLVVFAGRVHLMAGWTMVGEVEQQDRWTAEDLAARQEELFAGRDPGLPEFGFGR